MFDTPPRPDRRGGLLRPSLPGEHPQHGWRYYGVLGGGGVHHAASPAVYRPAGGAARSVQSLAAKKYVGEHYMDSGPSLDGVAAQLGISPLYLSRIFSEIDGKRFTQYLSGLHIEKAKQLPADDSRLVRDIGQDVGFLTIQHFMRVFKAKTGVTAGEYRSTLPKKGG
ncbi:MAG: helix-turn-helix transcriptional regulator [Oscillospiraceae bacterium]